MQLALVDDFGGVLLDFIGAKSIQGDRGVGRGANTAVLVKGKGSGGVSSLANN